MTPVSVAAYLLFGVGALVGVWIVLGDQSVRGIETPKYSITKRMNGYEVRQYDEYILAKTNVTGSFTGSLNRGFRIIAGYIFGNNTPNISSDVTSESKSKGAIESQASGEKIPMTAPVLSEKLDLNNCNEYSISFVMPSKYTIEKLPIPGSNDVQISKVDRHTAAVMKFSGIPNWNKISKMNLRFKEMLACDGFNPKPSHVVAQYDPPWIFPLVKRNELIIELYV